MDPSETQQLSQAQVARALRQLENPRAQNPPALVALDGAPEPTLLVLRPGDTTIGRGDENTQILHSEGVSRQHVKLTVSADLATVTVADLGSRNGTWLNRERLQQPARLRRGDILQFGLAVFRFLPFGDPDLGNAYTRKAIYGLVNEADEQRLQEHLELITGLSSAFATSINLEETLHNSLLQITTYLEAEAASLFLRDASGRKMVCRAAVGPVDITGLAVDPDTGIIGRTLREGRSQRVADVRTDPTFSARVDGETGFVTRSILCAPLCIGTDTFGALEVINRKGRDSGFDERDRCVLSALASSAALAIHSANMAEKQLVGERVQKELELASALQRSFFPTNRGDGFPIQGVNVPAREVSGDFFDILELEDGRIFFTLGDVSGKGINAALLTAKTSSLLRFLSRTTPSPAAILAAVNRELAGLGAIGMFVTVCAGFFDPASSQVRFANAGHPPPLIHLGGDRFLELPMRSMPLGIAARRTFPEMVHDLGEGDGPPGICYLYSDGLVEGCGSDGAPLGVDGLKETVRRHAHLPPSRRLERITAAVSTSAERFDDVTLLILEPAAARTHRLGA